MNSGFFDLFRVPELRKRIFFTLFIIAVYRLGAHIPTPGIDATALQLFFERQSTTFLGFMDMFSGGALSRLTIFALGIMPYISASIILQLFTMVSPTLERLKKEGESGQRKITQYTRYFTVVLALVQGFGISIGLEAMKSPGGSLVVLDPGLSFRLMTMITLASGTVFLMWLGEQITEKGVGNGISLIIFSGIVAGLPGAIGNTFQMVGNNELQVFQLILLLALMAAVVSAIVYMETAQRRLKIMYAKRVVGRKMTSGESSHLPLKINTAGVIPPIFASSLIMLPATATNFIDTPLMKDINSMLMPGSLLYTLIYVSAIFFFCFFYTSIIYNPKDVAENVKKAGGFIPGIQPGKKTAQRLDHVLTRLTFSGAIYLSLVCIIPDILIRYMNVPFYFGGTGLLIVVGVAMDTMSQIESHLISRHYHGFLNKGRVKGRS